jgi:hypothetical protein
MMIRFFLPLLSHRPGPSYGLSYSFSSFYFFALLIFPFGSTFRWGPRGAFITVQQPARLNHNSHRANENSLLKLHVMKTQLELTILLAVKRLSSQYVTHLRAAARKDAAKKGEKFKFNFQERTSRF